MERDTVKGHLTDDELIREAGEALFDHADRQGGAFALTAQRARLQAALNEAERVESPLRGRQAWRRPLLASLPAWSAAAVVFVLAGILMPWLGRQDIHDTQVLTRPSTRPATSLTPGAVSQLSAQDLCAGRLPSRMVTEDVRLTVLRTYAMESVPAEDYELDALITPELGGTTEIHNLWPQRYDAPVWHARVKDVLERRLAEDVCAGRVELIRAQRDIATDWIASYRRYFHTEMPLQAHLQDVDDGVELEFVRADIAISTNISNTVGLPFRSALIHANRVVDRRVQR